ncbi:MAG: hypothetical protein POELPBGB_01357 [Bacteroidia bacterium]|nr:hypothetical protein [Bacteroidia bacterium]
MKKEKKTALDKRILKIAKKLKKLRIDSGFKSYETFANEYGINRVQYWRMEKGTNSTLTSLFIVLDIHELTLKEFFSDIE